MEIVAKSNYLLNGGSTAIEAANGRGLQAELDLYQELAARTVGGPGFPWITSVPITSCMFPFSKLKPVLLAKSWIYFGSVRNRPAASVPYPQSPATVTVMNP